MDLRKALRIAAFIFSFLANDPAFAQWDAGGPLPEAPQERAKTDVLTNPGNPALPPGTLPEEKDISPPTILHEPVTHGTKGAELRITTNILDRSGVASVTLYYRPSGTAEYRNLPMTQGIDGIFRADLPPEATGVSTITYYLEAVDRKNNGPSRLGYPDLPLLIHLDPLAGPVRNWDSIFLTILALFSSALAAYLFLWLRNRIQRNRTLDTVFWTKKLVPLLHLPAVEMTRTVTELSKNPLSHPVKGERVFPRIVIVRKLEMVKQLDLAKLVDMNDKYLKQEIDIL